MKIYKSNQMTLGLITLFTALLFSVTSIVHAYPRSQGCDTWNNAARVSAARGVGYGYGTLPLNKGEIISVTFNLNTATSATVSIREPIGQKRTGPVTFTSGTVTLRWRIPADGDYRIWMANEWASNGTVDFTVNCVPVPTPEVPVNIICDLADGRVNDGDCDSAVAIYQNDAFLNIYGINPETAGGQLALHILLSEIEAAGIPTDRNLLLAEALNPATNTPISLWRLTTGELQLNTHLPDGKPYVVTWYPESPWEYERLE